MLAHQGRSQKAGPDKTILFDLSIVNSGMVVGSLKYANTFLVHEGTDLSIFGSHCTSNTFRLFNANFSGSLFGSSGMTYNNRKKCSFKQQMISNTLDLSQIKDNCLFYAANQVLASDKVGKVCAHNKLRSFQMFTDEPIRFMKHRKQTMQALFMNHMLGRRGKSDFVNCKDMRKDILIETQGGLGLPEPDIVLNCNYVVLSGSMQVSGDAGNYTFIVKPYPGRIHLSITNGTGLLIFHETELLKSKPHFSYYEKENRLELQLGEDPKTAFYLSIASYFKEGKPRFRWIDQPGWEILPLISQGRVSGDQALRIYQLRLEGSIENLSLNQIKDLRRSLVQAAAPNEIYIRFQENVQKKLYVFGTRASDSIPIMGDEFIEADDGSDAFYLDEPTCRALGTSTLNAPTLYNLAKGQDLDYLYLDDIRLFHGASYDGLQSLWLSFQDKNQSSILCKLKLENYLKDISHQHLVIVNPLNEQHAFWIPYYDSIRKTISFLPYYHAHSMQAAITNIEEKDARIYSVMVMEADWNNVVFGYERNDLYLIVTQDTEQGQIGSFALKFKNFYGTQSLWSQLKDRLWVHIMHRGVIQYSADYDKLCLFFEKAIPLHELLEMGRSLGLETSENSLPSLSHRSSDQCHRWEEALKRRIAQRSNKVVSNLKMFFAVRQSLTDSSRLVQCLGFPSLQTFDEFIQAWIKEPTHTVESLLQVWESSEAIPSLIDLIASASMNGCRSTELLSCFDFLNESTVHQMSQALNSSAGLIALDRFVENHQAQLKLDIKAAFKPEVLPQRVIPVLLSSTIKHDWKKNPYMYRMLYRILPRQVHGAQS